MSERSSTTSKDRKGTLEIEVAHHFSSMGAARYYYLNGNHRVGYMDVLSELGVPLETGRRYRVTVEELPDSNPKPVENPWKKGQKA